MLFLIYLIATAILVECRVDYTGHKVLRIYPSNEEELNFLTDVSKNPETDFWILPSFVNDPVILHASPTLSTVLEIELHRRRIRYDVVTNNIQKWIDKERKENPPDTASAGKQENFRLDVYHTFEAIISYIDTVASQNAEIASVEVIGTTYKRNEIKGLKIGSAGSNKRAIWIDGGIHADEWIGPATAIYIIQQLVKGYDTDPEMKHLVDTFDWYIFPVVNPDGYKYSWTDDRLWRKNRNRTSGPITRSYCRGVDLNRNFDAGFAGSDTSESPCGVFYPGSQAFSEAESRAIRDGVLRIGERLKLYINLHSFSQLWMTPYGYTTELPPDYADQMRVLRAAVSAVQSTHGVTYKFGPLATTIYLASGTVIDWVYDAAKVKYSITVELRDTGELCFFVPKTQIVPNSEENFEGIKVVAKIIEGE